MAGKYKIPSKLIKSCKCIQANQILSLPSLHSSKSLRLTKAVPGSYSKRHVGEVLHAGLVLGQKALRTKLIWLGPVLRVMVDTPDRTLYFVTSLDRQVSARKPAVPRH